MRITIDRNLCGAWSPACEECFGTFVAHGFPPDRLCLTSLIDDGSPDLTALIHSGGFVGTLIVTDENRDAVISEGWRNFTTLPDEAFDIQPPHGKYWRESIWRG
jgi:hypothetical protein